MAKKKINTNGFDYLDLGLPSGTLWATMNVGAKKHTDYGLYFQFGDTQGYTKDQVGIDKMFIWGDYKFNLGGDENTFTKYNKEGEALEQEDDAAHVHMGGDWHIPTPEQIQELIDNTIKEDTTLDGVNGYIFTSKKDTSKSIFIPEAGEAWAGSVNGMGFYCGIWSSMLNNYKPSHGQLLGLYTGGVILCSNYRCNGFSIRGVIG